MLGRTGDGQVDDVFGTRWFDDPGKTISSIAITSDGKSPLLEKSRIETSRRKSRDERFWQIG